jgi:magnesium transporter
MPNGGRPRYPATSAGGNLIVDVPVAGPDDTIARVEELLLKKTRRFDSINYIYVLNGRQRLIGVISIKELFRTAKDARLGDIMHRPVISVRPEVDRERAALVALKHSLKSVPVTDASERLLGVIPSDVILRILHNRHIEEVLRAAGVHGFKDPAMALIKASASDYYRRRLPWLLLGLVGGFFAALIVSFFTTALEAELLLAAFIPAVVYIADAVGAQTQTIFIRSLAVEHQLKIRKYAWRELSVGLMLAVTLGGLMALLAVFWHQSVLLGAILAVSIFCTVLIAMAVAILLPLGLARWKYDPAIASGPFATLIRDLLSLVIYFSIASILLAAFR